MKNKRGISGVVTTILLVLLALGAVLLVWGLVKTQLSDAGTQIKSQSACLKLDIVPEGCTINLTSGNVEARYKRGSGDPGMTLDEVKLIYELADGTTSTDSASDLPAQLETKVHKSEGFASVPGNLPVKLKVAGVLTDENGNKNICNAAEIEVECK